MKQPLTSLHLHRLRIPVRLGCEAQERLHPQTVSFDVEIGFSSPPRGCLSDDLSETVCYAQISRLIAEKSSEKEYCLIEKLGWEVYQVLRNFLPAEIWLVLKANKEKPPIDHLEGGATFSISDRPLAW